MRPLDIVEYALTDFASSKFKTFMSALGIIIGVMAIVAMLTLGDTISSVFGDMNGNMDLDTIAVLPPSTIGYTSSQLGLKGPSATLTDRDLKLLMGIPGVSRASPMIEVMEGATYRGENVTTPAIGIMPQYEDRLAGDMYKGRFLTPSDTNAVVVGSDIANNTFSKKLVPGARITLTDPSTNKSSEYVVVGILKQVNSTMFSGNVNSAVLMTRAGLKHINSRDTFSRIIVRVGDVSKEDEIMVKIIKSLGEAHKNEGVFVYSASEYYGNIALESNMIKYVLGGIAAISLLVGGIGIMNVMMLTIRERTKEIGLMKAIGATTMDVRMIFIIEAMLMGLLGGMIGAGVAELAYYIISYLGHFTVNVSPQNALVGIAFGLASTLVFGVYPASQASKLDPIDALRTE